MAATRRRTGRPRNADQQAALPAVPDRDAHLDIAALKSWLWDAACAIRGAADAPKFTDFISSPARRPSRRHLLSRPIRW